jgi:hypothetical protein
VGGEEPWVISSSDLCAKLSTVTPQANSPSPELVERLNEHSLEDCLGRQRALEDGIN